MNEIIKHYENCLESNTDPYLQVDWSNREAAKIRYEFFSNIHSCTSKSPILDYGCGVGNFCSYVSPEYYVGCDISKKMIEAAKLRYPDYSFYSLEDLNLKEYESIIINGVFTEKRNLSHYEMYYEIVVPTLKTLWKHTECVLAVNFMNAHSLPPSKQRPELFFLDANELATLARFELKCTKYKIDSSYLPYEHTLQLFK